MPVQQGAMRSRWTAYAGISAALAAGVILKALAQRPNFYSASVYLSQSNANLMILCNLVFVTACSVILFLQRLLYGPLRPIEIEQLYEKAWFAVTETCLAMTIFRGEIGAWFLVMFFSLLAGKVWGWIGEGRVEVLEQQQHNVLAGGNARLFHTRLAASLALSVIFDLTMLEYIVGQVLHMARPDMMVMFGFEFAVLSITSLSTAMRYGLNLVEIDIVRRQKQKRIDAIRKTRIDTAVQEAQAQQSTTDVENDAPNPTATQDLPQRIAQAIRAAIAQPIDDADVEVEGWDGKGRWVFYLDLATDFFKLVVYLSFFFILLIFYGLPLHIMRDVFLTCRSFFKRIADFMRYRTATRDMNERYPDAADTEIGREDVCIICREDMRPYVPPAQGQPLDPVVERMRPKKLPCGHVLHFSCLRSWLERQQICPTCRAPVVPRSQTRPGTGAGAGAGAGNNPPQARPANGANNRPRVFQFGPLRIGVGAARGNNMLQEMEDQLANVDQPAQGGNGPPPQQQFGFGIRWGDGARRRPPHRRSIEDQLSSVERQIQREVDSLQANMGELQALRNIQAQLTRVRLAHQAVPDRQPAPPGPILTSRPQTQFPAITTVNPMTQNPNAATLHAGSEQLPPGLTLPEGWTMMPLQPMTPHPPQPLHMHMAPTPLRMPPPIPHAVQAFGLNVGHMGHMPPNIDMQALIDHGHEVARAAAAHQEAVNNLPPHETGNPQVTNLAASEISSQQSRNAADAASNTTRNPAPSIVTPVSRPQPPAAAQIPRIPRPEQSRPVEPSIRSHHRPLNQPAPPSRSPSNPTSNPIDTQRRYATSGALPAPPQLNSAIRNGSRTISQSPHRPNKSIGSSWGFSGVEQSDDSDDEDDDKDNENEKKDVDDDDDDDSDEDSDENKVPPRQTAAQQTTQAKSRAATSLESKGKGKTPTVEDLVEDPD